MPGSVQCIGRLFGQTPESLVETDPAVDAAQGTQSSESSKAVPSAVGDTTAHEIFLQLCGVISYVELIANCPAIGGFLRHLLNITDGLQY